MTPIPTKRITEEVPPEELRRLIRTRTPFRNLRGTFRGIRMTPEEVSRVGHHPDIREILTPDCHLALILDEPDYVVWSGKAPIAWHSTTRGIAHRTDVSSWTYVLALLRLWPDRQTQKRYNRMVGVIHDLNERVS